MSNLSSTLRTLAAEQAATLAADVGPAVPTGDGPAAERIREAMRGARAGRRARAREAARDAAAALAADMRPVGEQAAAAEAAALHVLTESHGAAAPPEVTEAAAVQAAALAAEVTSGVAALPLAAWRQPYLTGADVARIAQGAAIEAARTGASRAWRGLAGEGRRDALADLAAHLADWIMAAAEHGAPAADLADLAGRLAPTRAAAVLRYLAAAERRASRPGMAEAGPRWDGAPCLPTDPVAAPLAAWRRAAVREGWRVLKRDANRAAAEREAADLAARRVTGPQRAERRRVADADALARAEAEAAAAAEALNLAPRERDAAAAILSGLAPVAVAVLRGRAPAAERQALKRGRADLAARWAVDPAAADLAPDRPRILADLAPVRAARAAEQDRTAVAALRLAGPIGPAMIPLRAEQWAKLTAWQAAARGMAERPDVRPSLRGMARGLAGTDLAPLAAPDVTAEARTLAVLAALPHLARPALDLTGAEPMPPREHCTAERLTDALHAGRRGRPADVLAYLARYLAAPTVERSHVAAGTAPRAPFSGAALARLAARAEQWTAALAGHAGRLAADLAAAAERRALAERLVVIGGYERALLAADERPADWHWRA